MKPSRELADRLAGEYVLGTLRGGARRRFEHWLREQPTLQDLVLAWQRRLGPMAALLPRESAPAGTWTALERRLFGAAEQPARGWKARLAAAWAVLASLALAAVVGVIVLAPERFVSPETLARRTEKVPAAYMAVLSAFDGRPSLVASAPRHSDKLDLKVLRPRAAPEPGTRYVLWAHATDGRRFALGAIDLAQRSRVVLAGTAEQTLSNVAALSVTAEPAGPALPAQPTHIAMLIGPCVKVW